MEKVNVLQKFKAFDEHWTPKIAGELNGHCVKLVKIKGPFTWHHHENEDEFFYVVKGSFEMKMRDQTIELSEGDFIIVPKGVEHCPSAKEEAWILLFEPSTTLNTGNKVNEFTKRDLDFV